MRVSLLLLLIIISFNYIYLEDIIREEIVVKITNLISYNITSNGYLFLETDGILLYYIQERTFNLSIISNEDKSEFELKCFFYKCTRDIGPAMIACDINSQEKIKIGKYHLKSLESKMSFIFNKKYIVNILPFNLDDSFNIVEGEKLNFYSKKIESIKFSSITETAKINFDLFVDTTTPQKIDIYLGDIPITCDVYGSRMNCLISANIFPQDLRSQSFNVYIKDSQGNKIQNYFIYPIKVILEYIEKKKLKIKVTKLLTNCLTQNDYIVFDTSDNILDNVMLTSQILNLKVKKDDYDSNTNELHCGFHKHYGETTKIFCFRESDFRESDLEEGPYYFEEYISEGPLKDQDKDSLNYNIIIPTFKSNSRFIYSSKDSGRKMIFDIHSKEKLELNFKNKDEILNITLYTHYSDEGKDKYFLGNSQIEWYEIDEEHITCGFKANNFESSGIYYIEKMNFLGENERIYTLPPVEVNFLWNK